MTNPNESQDLATDARQLDRIEELLVEIRNGIAPKLWQRLAFAAVQGFGYILGATVLILVLTTILQPFSRLEYFGDKFERAIEALERRPVR